MNELRSILEQELGPDEASAVSSVLVYPDAAAEL